MENSKISRPKSERAFVMGVISITTFFLSTTIIAILSSRGSVALTLFPLILVLGSFVLAIIGLVKGIKGIKPEGSVVHKVLGLTFNGFVSFVALIFVIVAIVQTLRALI
ncbi:MAG: hypothetical protein N4A72_13530 [Bacteroidales bacterium]|jgi:hypothetical protein|nr:hypothetical protein [Bacteroidales bacterium]